MRIPHPVQYPGRKRSLAPLILRYLPVAIDRLVEPFAGSAAISVACAARNRACRYWLNDANQPLASLLRMIIDEPHNLADKYEALWTGEQQEALARYYRVRDTFNQTLD